MEILRQWIQLGQEREDEELKEEKEKALIKLMISKKKHKEAAMFFLEMENKKKILQIAKLDVCFKICKTLKEMQMHPNVRNGLAILIGDEYLLKDNIPEAEKVYLFAYEGYPKESAKKKQKKQGGDDEPPKVQSTIMRIGELIKGGPERNLNLAEKIIRKCFSYAEGQNCKESKTVILTEWIKLAIAR